MRVEPVSNGNLRIWLRADELPTESTTSESWSLLHRVLLLAQRSFGRQGKQLVAELIPVADGGILLVSARTYTLGGTPVYRVDRLEDMYSLAEAWVALSPVERSNVQTVLYELAQGYAVVLYPHTHLTRAETALLHTYGTLIGSDAVTVAQVAEYGRLLAEGDVFCRLTACEPMPPAPPDPAS